MVSKGRCIAADRQSASRECISPARSQNICIVCVCVSVIRGPGEETQTINGGQMVERRREASVCVWGRRWGRQTDREVD